MVLRQAEPREFQVIQGCNSVKLSHPQASTLNVTLENISAEPDFLKNKEFLKSIHSRLEVLIVKREKDLGNVFPI